MNIHTHTPRISTTQMVWTRTLPKSHWWPGFHFCAYYHIHHCTTIFCLTTLRTYRHAELMSFETPPLSICLSWDVLTHWHPPISLEGLSVKGTFVGKTDGCRKHIYLFMRSITACDMWESGTAIRKAQTFQWRHEHPPFTTISAAFRPQEKTITPPGLPI